MASDFSFDIVSDFDRQELVNAVDQAKREIITRYDLKDTKTELTLEEKEIVIRTESEMKLQSVIDLMMQKAMKRNLSLKIFDLTKPKEAAGGSTVKQVIPLKKGLSPEQAKTISKMVREQYPKVKASIFGDVVRVAGKSKDDLQDVMTMIRGIEFEMPLSFTNYR